MFKNIKDQFNQFLRKGIKGCGELKVSRKWDDPLIGNYLELVQELFTLAKTRSSARLEWIKAHDGSRWNEYVDTLANLALVGEVSSER